MKLLAISALCIVAVYCKPTDRKDECGAVDIEVALKKKFVAPGTDFDVTCEICLDLVLIAETYAECDEAEVQHALDNYCVTKVKNKASQQVCKGMVDQIAHEVITDTEQDPTAVCKKVVHKTCTYGVQK